MNKIEKLKLLPETPGVYIMLDENKNVLYVGKAKNLKNRVRQYFQSPIGKPEKVLAMVSRVYDFNYIIVPSETDAFALENTLIKKYTPPYNILLKDGKQYPYIKINTRSPYPKILLTRKVMDDHCRYFGPIVNNSKSLLEVTNKLFPTVTCNYNLLKLPKNFRPCLNYHIGKCPAPCINAISKEDYKARIDKAIEFLSGNDKEALTLLTQKMTDASEKEQYEEALNYRNYIQVINKLQESRIATLRRIVDYDIFAISSNGNNAVVNHTVVRAGKVVLSDNIPVSDAGIDEKQTLTSYISLYGDYNTLCGDIITNLDLEDSNTLSSFLSVKCNRKITVSVGARGERRKLAEMS
ncbi:MAG: excinuclease ABC subunit UvrC, partial [Clostridia bacterium]